MNTTQVFVSFDAEHDEELYELLLAQSGEQSSCFTVLGCSERATTSEAGSERVRRWICKADQVIVICGEHTESSPRVSSELRIAQQEGTPYFLLWGRREMMCTKPIGARPADGMYSWTQQIMQNQITFNARKASVDAKAGAVRNATRKG